MSAREATRSALHMHLETLRNARADLQCKLEADAQIQAGACVCIYFSLYLYICVCHFLSLTNITM